MPAPAHAGYAKRQVRKPRRIFLAAPSVPISHAPGLSHLQRARSQRCVDPRMDDNTDISNVILASTLSERSVVGVTSAFGGRVGPAFAPAKASCRRISRLQPRKISFCEEEVSGLKK